MRHAQTCRHVRRHQYYVLVEYNCPHIAVLCALSQLGPLHVLCAHKRETCIVILQTERWTQETEAPPLSLTKTKASAFLHPVL